MRSSLTLAGVVAACLAASPASATLLLHITGTPGGGSTTWTFSGSSVANGSGSFSANETFDVSEQWHNVGSFTSLDLFSVPDDGGSITGAATLSVGAIDIGIDSVFVDMDVTSLDDLGIGVAGSTDLDFVAGDLVSWTGSLVVAGIDLNDLDETTLPATLNASNFGQVDDVLALTLKIGEAAVVPLPAGAPLVLTGVAVLGLATRRRTRGGRRA
ncbi:MAG: hypothetical protein RIM80_24020 [Alphaproteobacteria bacterium]